MTVPKVLCHRLCNVVLLSGVELNYVFPGLRPLVGEKAAEINNVEFVFLEPPPPKAFPALRNYCPIQLSVSIVLFSIGFKFVS